MSDFIKIKIFYFSKKKTAKKIGWQATEWEKIFEKYTSLDKKTFIQNIQRTLESQQ